MENLPETSPRHGIRHTLLVMVAISATVGIGWIDLITGPDLGLSLFYLVPIIVCGWRIGRIAAVIVAVGAAAAWFAADYVARPAPHLAVSLWNTATRLGIFTLLGILAAIVRQDRRRLTALLAREQLLARTDPLTGLANSREFLDALHVEVARSQRSGHSLCVAYLDLDNFKQVNDRFGHAAGDEALARIAGLVRGTIRATDLAARLGGDELAVIFWNIDPADVEKLARRIADKVREVAADYPGTSLGVTTGIAFFARPPSTVEELVRLADSAMYEGKAAGKGRTVLRTFE